MLRVSGVEGFRGLGVRGLGFWEVPSQHSLRRNPRSKALHLNPQHEELQVGICCWKEGEGPCQVLTRLSKAS